MNYGTKTSPGSAQKWSLKRLYEIPRPLLIAFYIDCTVYAPVELTRAIIQFDMHNYPVFAGMLWMEVAVIWVYYAMSIALISALLYYRRPVKNN